MSDHDKAIPVSIPPETILEEAQTRWKQYQDAKAADEENRREAEKTRMALRFDAVYQQLTSDISDASLLASLRLEQVGEFEFRLKIEDIELNLRRIEEYGKYLWRMVGIFTPSDDPTLTSNGGRALVFDDKIEARGGAAGWMRQPLLVAIGSSLDGKERWLAAQALKRQKQAVETERQAEKAETERRAYQALKAENAEIEAEIEARKLNESQNQWQWPHGFTLTYYRLTFLRGAYSDEAGELRCEYETGYTLTDSAYTNRDGYFDFWLPGVGLKQIRLIYNIHLPLFERMTASSLEEVPPPLCEAVTVDIGGIRENYYGDEFVYQRDENEKLSVSVGRIPVAWLRESVNARSAIEAGVAKTSH